MTIRMRSLRAGAVFASTFLVATAAPFVGTANAQESVEPFTVTDAQFRWGMNIESGTRAYAPGTFNIFSAGDVTEDLLGPHQQLPSSAWKASDGNVAIEKCDANGKASAATWASTQTTRSGGEITTGDHNGLEVVFSGGEGEIDPDSGTGEITWKGTYTILYYSGMASVTVSDPVLTITSSGAEMTAEMGGFESSMEDTTKWERMDPQTVTLADFDRRDMDLSGEDGMVVLPEYLGVSYEAKPGETPQVDPGDDFWGAFPTSFIDFMADAGSGSYWYTSGGGSDRLKPTLPMNITWDGAGACLPDVQAGSGSGSSGGLLSDVLNDFVEGVAYDISDIFQTRIREDLDSVINGDATWGDLGSSDLAETAPTGARVTGAAVGGAATSETVDSGGDPGGTSEDPDDDVLPASGPVNAGTVGYAVTTATSPTSGGSGGSSAGATSSGDSSTSGSSGGNAAPAINTVADNSYPLASERAAAGEVYYAHASADSAVAPFTQWQWWLGGALLAIAAGLTYLTVRGKV